MNLRERLGTTPHFQELDGSELDALAASMELVEVPDGHVLVREGERGDGCYLIVDGSVRITCEVDGRVTRIQELAPGELFGLVALLDDGRRSATCTAVGTTTVAWLPAGAFTMLHEGNPALVLHFQKMVARQLARDARRLNASLVQAMLDRDDRSTGSAGSLSGELHLSAGD